MSDADNDQPRKLAIAECVAAMDMLRQQICGMYALLDEQQQAQQAAADRLDQSQRALQKLADGLPNDVLTLTAIRVAATSVKQAIATMPNAVVQAATELKTHTAAHFEATMAPQVKTIERASTHMVNCAHQMNHALSRFDLLTCAALVICGCAAGLIAGGLLFQWNFGGEIAAIRQRTEVIHAEVLKLGTTKTPVNGAATRH